MKACCTDEFWDKMCSPRFIRTSHYCGRIGNYSFLCLRPPEDVDGFLASKIGGIFKALGYKEGM